MLARDRLVIAALDLVCVCGFVVAAVLTRGVAASGYRCGGGWLAAPSSGGGNGSNGIMRRMPAGHECTLLKSVFGMAIAVWSVDLRPDEAKAPWLTGSCAQRTLAGFRVVRALRGARQAGVSALRGLSDGKELERRRWK